jgi:hypothetical protein
VGQIGGQRAFGAIPLDEDFALCLTTVASTGLALNDRHEALPGKAGSLTPHQLEQGWHKIDMAVTAGKPRLLRLP